MSDTAAKAKTEQKQSALPPEPDSKGAVATIAPPRLAYPLAAQDRFGIDRAAWKALVEAIFPAAKTSDSIILALAYCKARKLDPFKRVVHIVPIWDSQKKCLVESVWPGISELRTTAHRTKQYAGADATVFGDDITETFANDNKTVTLTFPAWAQITVYRLVDGVRCAFPGPRIIWKQAYGKEKQTNVPNSKWASSPSYMLEKVAEAAALRKAFPEELGNELSAEEMEGREVPEASGPIIDQEPQKPRPTRADARAAKEQAEDMDRQYKDTVNNADPETCEVKEHSDTNTDSEPDNRTHGPVPPSDIPPSQETQGQAASPASSSSPTPVDYVALATTLIGKIERAGTVKTLTAITNSYADDFDQLRTEAPALYSDVMAKHQARKAWFARS